MSLRCMVQVLERYPTDGGPGEKLLALCLADNANEDGERIYPSVDTMALRSLQSVRTVQEQVKRMLAMGWLQVVKRGGGRGRSTHYRINPDWLKGADIAPFPKRPAPVDKLAETPQSTTEKGADWSIKTPQSTTEKGADWSTPIEPYRTCHRTTPLPPARRGVCAQVDGEDSGDEFQRLVVVYPRKRADGVRAAVVWARLRPSSELGRAIVAAAAAMAATDEWREREGQYAPKLSKWLRNRGWEQAPVPAPIVSTPAPLIMRELTPEQQQRNAQRARELIAHARSLGYGAGLRTRGVA